MKTTYNTLRRIQSEDLEGWQQVLNPSAFAELAMQVTGRNRIVFEPDKEVEVYELEWVVRGDAMKRLVGQMIERRLRAKSVSKK